MRAGGVAPEAGKGTDGRERVVCSARESDDVMLL